MKFSANSLKKLIKGACYYEMPYGSETNQFWNGQKSRLWR